MRLIKISLYLFIFLGLTSCLVNPEQQPTMRTSKIDIIPPVRIKNKTLNIAYIHQGNRQIDENSINLEGVDIVNFAFASVKDNKPVLLNSAQDYSFKRIPLIKKRFPGIACLISIGGYGTAEDFSVMAREESQRNTFITQTIKLIRYYGFDGVDLDWEFPGMSNYDRQADKQNFTLLIKELRFALDAASKHDKRKYLFTIAAGAFPAYLNFTEPRIVASYLDYIYLMTYDFMGQWNIYTGHHTNLYASKTRPGAVTIDRMVNLYINAGVPSKKIVIAAAFYGRRWTQTENVNYGLYRKGQGVGSIQYNKIENLLKDSAYVTYWDTAACAPYLYNSVNGDFISFDNALSLKYKVQYAKLHDLGGIMSWEYFSDSPDRKLSETIREQLTFYSFYPGFLSFCQK